MKNHGLLLHISSLPTDYGIGDFGPAAYQFADFLSENGFRYWQILPLYQAGYGNSPYNPLSAFALNPYLISPDLLFEDGLIDKADLQAATLPRSSQVHYEAVYRLKDSLLSKASANYLTDNEIIEYIESNALNMKPYLAYIMLSKLYGDYDWHHFRAEHRQYDATLYQDLFKRYRRNILQCAAIQALALDQANRLRSYLNSQGLQLIGDMPLYLSYHSAEVWANQQYFDLDDNGNRLHVAGVPADAFSSEGQLWGNPLYRWERLREDGFELFLRRIGHALGYLDRLRLDHFIGYVNYWSVSCSQDPVNKETLLPQNALDGEWVKALPDEFFANLGDRFTPDSFIAEDLGILNPEVCRYRDLNHYPGMVILQFCFEEGVPDTRSFPAQAYIYTGTHDNPTAQEWFANLAPDAPSRQNLLTFVKEHPLLFTGLGLETEADIGAAVHKVLCIIARNSNCHNVILPVQDLLGLDSEARMNVPGTALGNWQWRLNDLFQLTEVTGLCGEERSGID